jgi:glycine dehydrogenase subunit 2
VSVERLVDFLPAPLVGIVEEGDSETASAVWLRHTEAIHRTHESLPRSLRRRTCPRVHLHRHARTRWLKDISQYAVLNANYLQARLRGTYKIPYDRICMHEFVMEGQFEGSDIRALDISKR